MIINNWIELCPFIKINLNRNRTCLIMTIIIISMLIFNFCGAKSEKPKEKKQSDTEKIEQVYLPKDTQPLTAAILDFTNKSGNKKDEIYRTQIPDQLSVDISSWFSLIPNPYVRKKIIDFAGYEIKSINQNDLFDQTIAKKIGKKLNVDSVIIGQYTILGDNIQIIIYMLNVNSNEYQNFRIEGKLNDIFKLMDKISVKTLDKAKISFKPVKVKEKKLLEEATAEHILEKISDIAIENSYDTAKPRSIKDDDLIEENPSPAPEWLYKMPSDNEYLYYIGRAYEQKDYSSAFKVANEHAFENMSRTINTSVDSQYVKIQKNFLDGDTEEVRKLVKKNLIVRSLSNVRGAQIWDRYNRKYKSSTDKKKILNDVAVLYRISKDNVKEGIKESIAIEKFRAEERKLLAEKEKLEAERRAYISQMKLLEKMKNKQIGKVIQPEQKPIYKDRVAKKTEKQKKIVKEKKISEAKDKKEIDKNPYRLYAYIAGGVGVLGLSYGIYQGINMMSLIDESDKLEREYDTLTNSDPQSLFVEKQNAVNDKRDEARSAELQMYISGGLGLSLIGGGVFLYLYEEESPVNVTILPDYSEVSFAIRF